MRVGLIARNSLFTVRGGDTIQVLNTARELERHGVRADIHLAAQSIDYTQYDLLHFFNLTRPADHLLHARRSRKPYVLSTIFVDYSSFDSRGRGGISGAIAQVVGPSGREYLKNLYRYMHRQDKLVSWEYLLGHLWAERALLRNAALVLPNSHSEYSRVVEATGVKPPYRVVPNGIDPTIFGALPTGVVREDKVLCVAQIYGRKNQLELIRSCQRLGVKLEIVGAPPPNHSVYFKRCREESGAHVTFHEFTPQEQLVRLYASSKVHALPSWFETTGLSSLEAGALGCELVVGAGGDTREYFPESLVHFCEADDPCSIDRAISEAMSADSRGEIRDKILGEYTWERAALATLHGYEEALDSRWQPFATPAQEGGL